MSLRTSLTCAFISMLVVLSFLPVTVEKLPGITLPFRVYHAYWCVAKSPGRGVAWCIIGLHLVFAFLLALPTCGLVRAVSRTVNNLKSIKPPESGKR